MHMLFTLYFVCVVGAVFTGCVANVLNILCLVKLCLLIVLIDIYV